MGQTFIMAVASRAAAAGIILARRDGDKTRFAGWTPARARDSTGWAGG
jgi:hypothetical protein